MQSVSRAFLHLGRKNLLLYTAFFQLVFFACYLLVGAVHGTYADNVCNWDCNWYRGIASRGYDLHPNAAGYADWAFFPLFPMVSAALMNTLRNDFVTDATIVNFFAFLALTVTSVLYFRARAMIRDELFAAFVFVAFPYGLYFRLPYTESFYGLLVIGAVFLAYERRLIAAGFAAGLACACRPTGVLLVMAIGGLSALPVLYRLVRGAAGSRRAAWIELRRIVAFGIIGCSGLLIYAAYLDIHVGDPLAFSHAMGAWDRHYANPLSRIVAGLRVDDMTARNFLASDSRSQTYLAIFGVLGALMVVWALVQKAFVEAALLAGTLVLAASTGLESLPRYMFCNPLSIGLIAVALEKLPVPMRWSVVAIFGALQLLLVIAWFNLSAFMT